MKSSFSNYKSISFSHVFVAVKIFSSPTNNNFCIIYRPEFYESGNINPSLLYVLIFYPCSYSNVTQLPRWTYLQLRRISFFFKCWVNCMIACFVEYNGKQKWFFCLFTFLLISIFTEKEVVYGTFTVIYLKTGCSSCTCAVWSKT